MARMARDHSGANCRHPRTLQGILILQFLVYRPDPISYTARKVTSAGRSGHAEKVDWPAVDSMSEQHHREELKIALDSSHPNHILPPWRPPLNKYSTSGAGPGKRSSPRIRIEFRSVSMSTS